LDKVESISDPQSHRLRELGQQIYHQYKFKGRVSLSNLAEWKRVADEANEINRKDQQRRPALWYAAAIGDVDMVSFLLRSLWRSRPEIARLLVNAGAELDGEIAGKDFLMLAARLGLNDLVEKGIAADFDASRWSGGMNRSNALYEAARSGHLTTVKFLIGLGERLPADTTNRSNLFRFAAEHPGVLEPLLGLYIKKERTRRTDTRVRARVRDSKNDASIAFLERFGIR